MAADSEKVIEEVLAAKSAGLLNGNGITRASAYGVRNRKNSRQIGPLFRNTLSSTIRDAQIHCDFSAIRKVLHRRKRQTAAHRITHPSVACWVAKYNGELVAFDIISPIADSFDVKSAKEYPSSFTIYILSGFAIGSLLITSHSIRAWQVFTDDLVRSIGTPRRVIADLGGTTLYGEECGGGIGSRIRMADDLRRAKMGYLSDLRDR